MTTINQRCQTSLQGGVSRGSAYPNVIYAVLLRGCRARRSGILDGDLRRYRGCGIGDDLATGAGILALIARGAGEAIGTDAA